jgi:hypothetical protein
MSEPAERIQRAFEALLAEEKRRLFAPVASYLAPLYKNDPVKIAQLCDERLDPTGNLLGWVRIEAGTSTEQTRGQR